MKTIILEEPGSFQLTDTELPGQPGPGEALLQVRRVGICGTDLHAFRGRQPFFTYPRILGHELAVEILALGPEEQDLALKVGDICCVEPYLNCGHCIACRQGKTNCCTSLQTLGVHTDGGMREQVILPANKLHLAEDVPLDHLAIVEMLCIGAHAVRRAAPQPNEWALVIGVGPIGLSTAQFAKIAGAKVIAMDISEGRLNFCRRELGIEHTVNVESDPVPQLENITGGDLPTLVFDAHRKRQLDDGGPSTIWPTAASWFLWGWCKIISPFMIPISTANELTILSSRNATAADFAWVVENLQSGAVNLSPWITHHASPEALVQEFPDWLKPETGVIKAMLTFD